jgi:hypothetical protein
MESRCRWISPERRAEHLTCSDKCRPPHRALAFDSPRLRSTHEHTGRACFWLQIDSVERATSWSVGSTVANVIRTVPTTASDGRCAGLSASLPRRAIETVRASRRAGWRLGALLRTSGKAHSRDPWASGATRTTACRQVMGVTRNP